MQVKCAESNGIRTPLLRQEGTWLGKSCLRVGVISRIMKVSMIIMAFFQWWYGPGWKAQIEAIGGRMRAMSEMFSIRILVRTLFSPWKQIVTQTRSDQAVSIKLSAGVDNVVSRLVGFTMRSIVLLVATLSLVVVLILSIVIAIVWPTLPALSLFLIPLGFMI